MNDKRLFGYAAIIASLGFVLQSMMPANAFNGSHISLGSNPIQDATAICSATNTSVLFSNNSSRPFIITEIVRSYPTQGTTLEVNGQRIFEVQGHSNSELFFSFRSGLVISPGSTVYCGHGGYRMTISGYYTH